MSRQTPAEYSLSCIAASFLPPRAPTSPWGVEAIALQSERQGLWLLVFPWSTQPTLKSHLHCCQLILAPGGLQRWEMEPCGQTKGTRHSAGSQLLSKGGEGRVTHQANCQSVQTQGGRWCSGTELNWTSWGLCPSSGERKLHTVSCFV